MESEQIERASYVAAHAILAANLQPSQLVCPGAVRSYAVDLIASIIQGALTMTHAELELVLGESNKVSKTADEGESCTPNQQFLHLNADPAHEPLSFGGFER